MSAPTDPNPIDQVPRNHQERLGLAQRLYREYRTRCFWHSPRDLEITEELIPFVVKGLRASGGRRGFILASLLAETAQPEREPLACR